MEAVAYVLGGRVDRWLEIFADLSTQPGLARTIGLCGLTYGLPLAGRAEEAMAIAEEIVAAARDHGNPFVVAYAFDAYGRAFTQADPTRALSAFREGLAYAEQHRVLFWEASIARDSVGLEAVHGELEHALSMFDTAIDSSHRAGNVGYVAAMLAALAMFFDRVDRPEIAATVYGAAVNYAFAQVVIGLPAAVDHLRAVLGQVGVRPVCRHRCRHERHRRCHVRPPPDPTRAPPTRAPPNNGVMDAVTTGAQNARPNTHSLARRAAPIGTSAFVDLCRADPV